MMRAAAFATLLGLCAPVAAADQALSVKLVFFTADWCPNCRVLEPELMRAVGRVTGVERIDVDITNAGRRRESQARADEGGVRRLYDAYVGKTGFAAIAAADTGETIACVTSAYAAPEIEAALRRAVARIRTRPPLARADSHGTGCPAERRPT